MPTTETLRQIDELAFNVPDVQGGQHVNSPDFKRVIATGIVTPDRLTKGERARFDRAIELFPELKEYAQQAPPISEPAQITVDPKVISWGMEDVLARSALAADASNVEQPTFSPEGPPVPPEEPEASPGAYDILPDTFSRENPYFEDQTPEEQEQARHLMQAFGYDRVVAEGLQPPRVPHGNVTGAVRALVGGMTSFPMEPTEGADPLIEAAGSLIGEGIKYSALYKALPVEGVLADIAAGTASGALRAGGKAQKGEGISIEPIMEEALMTATVGGLMRAIPSGLKAAAEPVDNAGGAAKTTPPPETPKQIDVKAKTETPFEATVDDAAAAIRKNKEDLAQIDEILERGSATDDEIREILKDYMPEEAVAENPGENLAIVKRSLEEAAPPVVDNESGAVLRTVFGYDAEVAKSLQSAWSDQVDKMVEKIVGVVPGRISQAMHRAFVSPAPKEVKHLLKQAKVDQAAGRAEGARMGKMIKESIPEELQADAYKALDPKALDDPGAFWGYKKSTELPPEMLDFMPIVEHARDKIYHLGKTAADLGLFTEETFAQRAGEYLARYYTNTSTKEAMKQFRHLFKKYHIKGDRFKKRSLRTVKERIDKGLVTDPVYAVSRAIGDITFDVSIAQAMKKIGANKKWTRAADAFEHADEATQAGFVMVPDVPAYGSLRGQYVQKGIFQEIEGMGIARGAGSNGVFRELGDLHDIALSHWKFGKTALNPATHGRNVLSNVVLADLGGLPFRRVDVYAKALREYVKKGKLFDEAADLGLMGTDWYGAEIEGILEKGMLGNGSMVRAVHEIIGNTKAGQFVGKTVGAAGKLYQAEEHWFKLAMYIHQRSKGATPLDAAAHAQKHLFDYSDLSPMLKKLRQNPFGGPFLSFTAKALPVMVESAVKHPVRFWKWPAMFYALNEVGKGAIGMTDAEYNKMQDNLPEWQKNTFLTPKVVLPVRSESGNPLLLDLTYNLPWGNVGDQGQILKNIPVLKDIPGLGALDPFVGSNPFTNLAVELRSNQNLFTGRPLYDNKIDENLPGDVVPAALGGQATEAYARQVFRQLSPGLVANLPEVADAASGGKRSSGKEKDLMSTFLSKVVGIKIIEADLDFNQRMEVVDIKKRHEAAISRAYRVALDKSMTKEERKSELAEIKRFIDSLKKEAKEVVGKSEASADKDSTAVEYSPQALQWR